ncbi:adenine deaminase [Alkalihalobacillus hwajinpoensis]|uniref:adenine deaminase n=1 Tax=Guptibacillus hwajinpoensis TaxID=208199 RepID=UPI0018837C62|nr:adenine deaminase [Pseudalkalibacillus hwajinpoensis]MBF0705048.1 adenine deaminase [Pseudalkalibacillus hwajinpoensis]
MEKLTRRVQAAAGKRPADLVIKNGIVLDSYNLELIKTDVAIVDGVIAGLGDFEGHHIIDADGKYIVPSLIDAHVHIESAMVTPSEFANAVLPCGVTTIVTDPHEIANVCGSEGISYMLQDSENVPMDIFFMLPSSVPSTSFENSGATLSAEDLKPFYEHSRVLGLAEVMDYPSVAHTSPSMMQKLFDAQNKKIDGHAAGLHSNALNIYKSAGITTDHECITAEEALERIKRGMYVFIREGSVAKNLKQLIPAVTERNARRFMFCTDDKHIDDLINEGSVDHNIRLAIQEGVDPLLAIQMASLNVAECFGLSTKGAIAPGLDADFLMLDDIESFSISHVYRAGELVAESGKTKMGAKVTPSNRITSSVHLPTLRKDHLKLAVSKEEANVIELIPNQIVTKARKLTVDHDENGGFVSCSRKDLMKLAVIERHHHTGNIGLGVVKGFQFHDGAIATTVGHDSHNLIMAGTNDEDMIKAAEVIQEMQGGLAVIRGKKVIGKLPLPIAGLLSDKDYPTVIEELEEIEKALKEIGAPDHFNPFLTLSFLSLPVIPELKLTDLGLFHVGEFRHINIDE